MVAINREHRYKLLAILPERDHVNITLLPNTSGGHVTYVHDAPNSNQH